MTNVERAIETLGWLVFCGACTGGDCKNCERYNAKNMALEALKKQIAMSADKNDCCPLCHTYLKDDSGVEGGYCPNCGQRIQWEFED